MDSHEEALFQAVLAEPEQDAPRLVLADWYEEHGQPERAEFIRLQCRLAELVSPLQLAAEGVDPMLHEVHLAAGMGLDVSDSHTIELEPLLVREAELLRRWRRRWNGWLHRRLRGTPLTGQVKTRRAPVRGWAYQRGFVEALAVELSTLQQHSDILATLGPIRHLRVHIVGDPGSTSKWDWQHPLLGQVRSLRLVGGHWGEALVTSLLETPALANLQVLDLRPGVVWGENHFQVMVHDRPQPLHVLYGNPPPGAVVTIQPPAPVVVPPPPAQPSVQPPAPQPSLLSRWLRFFGLGD